MISYDKPHPCHCPTCPEYCAEDCVCEGVCNCKKTANAILDEISKGWLMK